MNKVSYLSCFSNYYIPPIVLMENYICHLDNNTNMNMITDNIYIGNLSSSINHEFLKETGIKGRQ